MTITEPEIVLGGGDPTPSAPPLSFNNGPPLVAAPTAQSLPIAVALPLSGATAPSPSASAPVAATASGASIERQTNADGSLSVKLTTRTARPDGGREIKIEYFEVPASMAASVTMSLDAGKAPATLYMTKMEQQVLPPGTGEVISAPPANRPNAPASNSVEVYDSGGISGPGACALCCGIACCVFIKRVHNLLLAVVHAALPQRSILSILSITVLSILSITLLSITLLSILAVSRAFFQSAADEVSVPAVFPKG